MAYDLKYGKVHVENGDRTHGQGGTPLNESDEPVFILRSQDKLALDTIRFYYESAEENGLPGEFVHGVDGVGMEFAAWQDEHPDRVKLPD